MVRPGDVVVELPEEGTNTDGHGRAGTGKDPEVGVKAQPAVTPGGDSAGPPAPPAAVPVSVPSGTPAKG
jgi:hypothetical protein